MFNVESILVPVDLTDPCVHTVEVARSLAETTDAELHLLHVANTLEPPVVGFGSATIGAAPLSVLDAEQNTTEHLARFIREHCPAFGGRLTTSVATGGVVPEVLKYAARHGIGLIVMGTRARGLLSRLVRGSISESVLERASCPVLFVPHRSN